MISIPEKIIEFSGLILHCSIVTIEPLNVFFSWRLAIKIAAGPDSAIIEAITIAAIIKMNILFLI